MRLLCSAVCAAAARLPRCAHARAMSSLPAVVPGNSTLTSLSTAGADGTQSRALPAPAPPPQPAAGMPFMITRKMRQQLTQHLGFSQAQVRAMNRARADELLTTGTLAADVQAVLQEIHGLEDPDEAAVAKRWDAVAQEIAVLRNRQGHQWRVAQPGASGEEGAQREAGAEGSDAAKAPPPPHPAQAPRAYILVDTHISNAEEYERYKGLAKPLAESHGAKYLTRGGAMDVVQDELWTPTRMVLIEFPTMKHARDFVNSTEYAPVKKIRLENSEATLLVLEGL